MQEISVVSRQGDAAVLSPVTIRRTPTTRLVFKPTLTRNQNDKQKPLTGIFAYQKKRKDDEWEDEESIKLNTLRAGDGVRLDLDTGEIHILKEWIELLYQTYDRANALPQENEVFQLHETTPPAFHYDFQEPAVIEPGNLMSVFQSAQASGRAAEVSQVLSWFLSKDNATKFIEHITRLNPDTIEQVNSLTGVARMKKALKRWEENRSSSDEKMWQSFLKEDSYILSQIFSFPVVMFGEEAYLGGKSVNQKGAKLIDFLLTTKLTNNVMLLEVKTPNTTLMGTEYRPGVYKPSPELVGPVAQVIHYKQVALTNYSANRDAARQQGINDFYEAFDPRCIVIVGNTSGFGGDFAKKRSFDLYRNNLRAVEIVTFDELFEKTRILVQLLEGDMPSAVTKDESDKDVPF